MDIQKIIQLIADLFTSKKRGDAPSAMLSQVLTVAKDIGDDDPAEAQSEVEGLIGRYGLNDGWLSTFTAEEREEIQPRRPSLVAGDNQDVIAAERTRPGSASGWVENSLRSIGIEFIQAMDFGIVERLIAKATEVGGTSATNKWPRHTTGTETVIPRP